MKPGEVSEPYRSDLGYQIFRLESKEALEGDGLARAKMQIREAPDACKEKGVPNHYHEMNSTSTELGPASACVTVALLTGKVPSDVACRNVEQCSDFVRGLERTIKGR